MSLAEYGNGKERPAGRVAPPRAWLAGRRCSFGVGLAATPHPPIFVGAPTWPPHPHAARGAPAEPWHPSTLGGLLAPTPNERGDYGSP